MLEQKYSQNKRDMKKDILKIEYKINLCGVTCESLSQTTYKTKTQR